MKYDSRAEWFPTDEGYSAVIVFQHVANDCEHYSAINTVGLRNSPNLYSGWIHAEVLQMAGVNKECATSIFKAVTRHPGSGNSLSFRRFPRPRRLGGSPFPDHTHTHRRRTRSRPAGLASPLPEVELVHAAAAVARSLTASAPPPAVVWCTPGEAGSREGSGTQREGEGERKDR